MKYLHKHLSKVLFFVVFALILNPLQGFSEPQCITDKTAIILSPFSWQRPERSELVQEMKSKLRQLGYNDIVIRENTEEDQQNVFVQDFVCIRDGKYDVAIILTHGNATGGICTGILLGNSLRVAHNSIYFDRSQLENSNIIYLGLTSTFWEQVNLDKKVLLIDACSVLADSYREKNKAGDTILIRSNNFLHILNNINVGGILGFNASTVLNWGTNFITNHFLPEIVNNHLDFASAVDTAKANYNEADDPGTPNAGEAAKRIGGEDFYLACVPPTVDIKINGSDNPIEIAVNQDYELTCSLDAGTYTGQLADFWWYIDTLMGRFPLMAPTLEAIQAPLEDFSFSIPGNTVGMEPGNYTFTFAVDDNADGILDGTWSDSVQMTIVEPPPTFWEDFESYNVGQSYISVSEWDTGSSCFPRVVESAGNKFLQSYSCYYGQSVTRPFEMDQAYIENGMNIQFSGAITNGSGNNSGSMLVLHGLYFGLDNVPSMGINHQLTIITNGGHFI